MADGAKLFVGQVPNTTTEDDLRALFSTYGTVTEVLILTDRATGVRKGCGFVTMATRAEGDAAIAATNDLIKLDGARRELIVRYATRNAALGGAVEAKEPTGEDSG
jgi:RNA recognition motif-containing protein